VKAPRPVPRFWVFETECLVGLGPGIDRALKTVSTCAGLFYREEPLHDEAASASPRSTGALIGIVTASRWFREHPKRS